MAGKTILEDILTLGSGLLESMMESRHSVKEQAQNRLAGIARELGLVSRDEFDAAFAMVAKARQKQEELAKRVAELESATQKKAPKKMVKKPTPRLPSVKTKAKPRRRK